MVRWVIGSILHGVDPLSYFSFQPVLHDWCNKGGGMCYHACGMVHIKEPLLLIEKSSPCGGSGFPLSLSEWSFTIIMSDAIYYLCLLTYTSIIICFKLCGLQTLLLTGTLSKSIFFVCDSSSSPSQTSGSTGD